MKRGHPEPRDGKHRQPAPTELETESGWSLEEALCGVSDPWGGCAESPGAGASEGSSGGEKKAGNWNQLLPSSLPLLGR